MDTQKEPQGHRMQAAENAHAPVHECRCPIGIGLEMSTSLEVSVWQILGSWAKLTYGVGGEGG